MLELAGRAADVVGINPRLSPDADPLAAVADMSPRRVREKIGWARSAAADIGRDPGSLEFQLRIFDVRVVVAGVEQRSISSHAVNASPEALAASVSVLHGEVGACVDRLLEIREQLGVSYIHLGTNLDAAAPIVARLAGR